MSDCHEHASAGLCIKGTLSAENREIDGVEISRLLLTPVRGVGK